MECATIEAQDRCLITQIDTGHIGITNQIEQRTDTAERHISIGQYATVGDRQTIAGSAVGTNGQRLSIEVPECIVTSNDNRIAIGTGTGTNQAGGTAEDLATVGNGQGVKGTGRADGKLAGVAPDRAGAVHNNRVTIRAALVTDVTVDVEHGAAVGNRQRVARAEVANVKVTAVTPNRAGTGDKDGVAHRRAVTANVTSKVERMATIGDCQRIESAGTADNKVTVVMPDGVSVGYCNGVAIGADGVANDTVDVEYSAAIGNRQRVARTGVANVEVTAVTPNGAGVGDEHRIVVPVRTNITSGVVHRATLGDI